MASQGFFDACGDMHAAQLTSGAGAGDESRWEEVDGVAAKSAYSELLFCDAIPLFGGFRARVTGLRAGEPLIDTP